MSASRHNADMDALQQVFEANFPGVTLPPHGLALLPTRRFAAGRSIFVQGQTAAAFFAVVRGEVEARISSPDGSSSVLEHIGPPRLFGLAAFAAGQPTAYEALALQPTELLVFGPQAYAVLMDEVPGFARALLAELARRFDGNLRLLQAARHHSAAERLELALQQLRRERGAVDQPPGWTAVSATQAELAALAHLSRQTVNELLAQRQRQGSLRLGRGRWWIKQA